MRRVRPSISLSPDGRTCLRPASSIRTESFAAEHLGEKGRPPATSVENTDQPFFVSCSERHREQITVQRSRSVASLRVNDLSLLLKVHLAGRCFKLLGETQVPKDKLNDGMRPGLEVAEIWFDRKYVGVEDFLFSRNGHQGVEI